MSISPFIPRGRRGPRAANGRASSRPRPWHRACCAICALAALAILPPAVGEPTPILSGALDALKVDPDDAQGVRAVVLTGAALGAHLAVLDRARERPDLFSAEELLLLEQDAAAQRIRHGVVRRDVGVSTGRHDLLDKAIRDPRTLDADRIVALRERGAFAEAAALHQRLDGKPLPDYAVAAAAEAWLALREPVRARVLFERAIDGRRGPVGWQWRVALAYAQHESEDPAAADATLGLLEDDVRAAVRAADNPIRRADALRWVDRVAILRAALDRFERRLDRSAERLAVLEEAIPFDLDVRVARAGLLMAQGTPRKALAVARRLRVDQPDSLWPRVTEIEALQAIGDHVEERHALEALRALDVEAAQTERLGQASRRHRAGTVRVGVLQSRSRESLASAAPGLETVTQTVVESRLMADRWRLVGQARAVTGRLEDGSFSRLRLGAGAGLALRDLDVTGLVSADADGGRPGGRLAVRHLFGDRAGFGIRLTRHADDVPLRALRDGVRLDTVAFEVTATPGPRTRVNSAIEEGRFSDGNRRRVASLAWEQAWHDTPRERVSTRFSGYRSLHRRSDVGYFSPAGDTTLGAALILDQILHRHYDSSWTHRLTLERRLNLQSGFGRRTGSSVRYEHGWSDRSRWGGRVALEHVRRPYDGIEEGRWIASADVYLRF